MIINENKGPNGKKGKLSQIWIRPNMALGKSHFFGIEARASGGEKEKERKEEEKKKKKKKSRYGNYLCMELYGILVWKFGTLVWKLFGLLVWKYHKYLIV